MIHHVQTPSTSVPRVITPADLDEALGCVARPGHRPIAGGTDLLIELDRGEHRDVEALVDLSRIAGLDQIDERDGIVTLGPLVTHNQCVNSELLRTVASPLVQASWEVGSPQLRNRATIAGNVVTASPANDTLSALAVLDASITLASAARGARTVPLAEFHLGVRSTVRQPDELLTAISFPALDDRWRAVYLKLGLRRAQAISVVHLAAALRFDRDQPELVAEARLALGSVAPTIVRVGSAEAVLVGNSLDQALTAQAAAEAAGAVTPIDDLRAPADYRVAMVAEMTERALETLATGAEPVLPDQPPLLWGNPTEFTSGPQPGPGAQTGSGARGRDGAEPGRWPTGPEYQAEHDRSTPVAASVNGRTLEAPWGGLSLLDWLRVNGLAGTKEGCAEGECGSCTIELDGMAALACLVPATRANQATVVTIEGLAESNGNDGGPDLHPLQQAFIDCGAVQCGFCIPGFLMSGSKLLQEHPRPTPEQIKAGLSGNLCRCTGYYKIEDAVRAALTTHDTAAQDDTGAQDTAAEPVVER